jgi:hypothetical protein
LFRLDIGNVPFAVLQPPGTKAMLIDSMSISVAPSLFDITRKTRTLVIEIQ